MTVHTNYTDARAHLAAYLDQVSDDRETVVIKRRGKQAVALVDAAELSSLEETAYLLRSPENARRLLAALERSLRGEIPALSPQQTAAQIEAWRTQLTKSELKSAGVGHGPRRRV
jgi:antitoxin YefM